MTGYTQKKAQSRNSGRKVIIDLKHKIQKECKAETMETLSDIKPPHTTPAQSPVKI
jgi:hypothetical protein